MEAMSVLCSNFICFGRTNYRRIFCHAPVTDRQRRWVAASAKKKKVDSHSFVVKSDEGAGFFPESVLLKPKKAQEDGKLLPEFADADEEEIFEFLNLKMESHLNESRTRHYEVVYLIHEDRVEEVENVISKFQDFIKEKNGKVWRLSNWGLRRLAYKIKKATHATYILMNFEVEAKWINEFKQLLDKDERIIRHLVIKRDEAITDDCPPPPEFHASQDDDYDDGDDQYLNDGDDEMGVITYVDGEDEGMEGALKVLEVGSRSSQRQKITR